MQNWLAKVKDWLKARRIWLLYQRKDHLDAYGADTDLRVADDPHAAVGGMWEEIGKLQIDFLVRNGLQPSQSFLDIGCGTLRAGRHIIRHLDPGKYTGCDISAGALRYAEQLVRDEGIAEKRPRLILNEIKELRFKELEGETFDVLLAQSVFTHLKPPHIEECFEHVGSVMHPSSIFYFTFSESPEYEQRTMVQFGYPFSFFQELADRHGFQLSDCSDDYPHPRGQRMLKLMKRQSDS